MKKREDIFQKIKNEHIAKAQEVIELRIKLPRIKHIKSRITIYFSLLIVLIIGAISFSISFVFSREIIDQTSRVVQQKIEIITRDIDEKLGAIKSLYANIRKDDRIQKLILKDNLSPLGNKKRINELSDILSDYCSMDTSIISIIIVDLKNQVLDPIYSRPPYNKAIIELHIIRLLLNMIILRNLLIVIIIVDFLLRLHFH